MIMIEILFWLFIFLIFYAYLGYPLLLVVLAVFLRKPVEKRDITPSVSLLISAYNEEKAIKQKIENSLSLDYPKERLEIIVISDASTDRTNEIALSYQDDGIKLIVQPERMGKTAGLNKAVPEAQGEIIVFTDANAMFQKDAIRKLVRPFADETIGFVSGTTRYISSANDGMNDGIGIYSRLEQFVKAKEGEIGSAVGADGAIFAIRKNLYKHFHSDHINDFIIPIQIVKKGFRGIQEDEAVCLEESAPSSKAEFRRQARIVNRCIKGLVSEWTLLNPFKGKLFALELFSHKVLKWLVPFLMLSIFFLNLLLIPHGIIYNVIFLCQISFFLFATMDIILERKNIKMHFFTLPYQFCFVNYAILKGWISFIRGNVDTIWTPERDMSHEPRKITVMHVVLTLDMAGMEYVVYNLTKNLNKALFEVVIVVILRRGPLAAEAEKHGIKVISARRMPRFVSFIYPYELIRLIKKVKPDIIHSHSGCWHSTPWAAKLCRVPVAIHTEHGRIFPDRKSIIFCDRIYFRFTDKLVTVSEYLTNYMKDIVELDSKKIMQVENGVDTTLFTSDERRVMSDDYTIGIVARLEPVKDHLTLINAFAEVIKAVPNCKLLIIGNGSQKQKIEERIQTLKLSDKALLLGERKDIPELLSIMDIFVLSSLSEGTSLTLLEAMASGKPVVATNVGGNGKVVINNETGFLVPPGEPSIMAEKIITLLNNRNLINEMGINGRNRVLEHFSLDKMVKTYEKLYLDCLNGK